MKLKRILVGVIATAVVLGGSYFGLPKGTTSTIVNNFENLFNEEIILEDHEAEIVRVVDGDTVIVNTSDGVEEKIRLLLIDTPESVHPKEPEQLFGKEASDYAKKILREGDIVKLEVGNPERDRYDRLLAYIWIDDVNFNQHMIEKGYARVAYVYPPNNKYEKEFREAEEKAKKQKVKIWSIENYVTEEGFDMSVVNDF